MLFKKILKLVIGTAATTNASASLLPWERTNHTGYGTITTKTLYNGTVLRVAINNPPLNLYDYKLNNDMIDFLRSLEAAGLADDTASSPPKTVIFHSVVEGFFMWWLNVNQFVPGLTPFSPAELTKLFDQTAEAVRLLRGLPTVFIAEVNGRASGSGNEFLLQCDMAFVGPQAMLGNPEAALGGMAGNGGTEYLVRAIGIQRASEYLLAAVPIQGAEAARIGWVNRAFTTSNALTSYTNGIAERIGYIDAAALNITKTSLRSWGPSPEQVSRDLTTLLDVAQTNIPTFRREIDLAGNFTTATWWTQEMFDSLESLKQLELHN